MSSDELTEAVRNANTDEVKQILDKGVDVNARDTIGYAPLHEAAKIGNIEIVQFLIDKGADVNVLSGEQDTPLHWASLFGHLDIVKLLVEKGADVNINDEDEQQPIFLAVKDGNYEVISFLLENGADIQSSNEDGANLLELAISNIEDGKERAFDVVKLLVEKGLDVNDEDSESGVPLTRAISIQNIDLVNFLLEKGAELDPTYTGTETPMQAAIQSGNPVFVKLLIEKGIPVNRKIWGTAPLLVFAAMNRNIEIVKYLLEAGADINEKEEDDGNTPLLAALEGNEEEIAEFLLEKGADVNLVNGNNDNPIFLAVRYGIKKVIPILLDKGVDVNSVDSNGIPLLHKAIKYKNPEVIAILLEKGADVEIRNDVGETPLIAAVNTNNLEVIKLLVDKGAKINDKSSNIQYTPLMRSKSIEVSTFLLEKGANINDVSKYGETALFFAVSSKNKDLVKFLIEKGADINIIDNRKINALYYAIETKQIDIAILLINAGSNVNIIAGDGRPLLHRAVILFDLSLIKLLVEKGVNVNQKNNRDITAFQVLIRILDEKALPIALFLLERMDETGINTSNDIFGISVITDVCTLTPINLRALRLILKKIDVNVQFPTNKKSSKNAGVVVKEPILDVALREAFERDQIQACVYLVNKGANPSTEFTYLGQIDGTARYVDVPIVLDACRKKSWTLVRACLDNGLNPDILFNAKKNGNIKLDIVTAAEIGNIGLIDRMLQRRYKVDTESSNGWTALSKAAFTKNTELVKFLLSNGADPNRRSVGLPALENSILAIDLPTINVLLPVTEISIINGGYDVNRSSLLLRCAEGGQELEDTALRLLQKGGSPEGNTNDKSSPLCTALFTGNTRVAKVLIENGADVNRPNNMGLTPLMIAALFQLLPTVKLLLERGADVSYAVVITPTTIRTKPPSDGKRALDFAPDQEMKDILTKPPYDLLLWKGYPKNEIEFFDSLFEDDKSMADISMCPYCLMKVFRSEACMYMKHSCPTPHDRAQIYNRYNFRVGQGTFQVCWCTLCGRPSHDHKHYKNNTISSSEDSRIPRTDVIPPPAGTTPFNPDCTNQGGGGIREKITRIVRLAECACKLQTQVNQITNWEARRMLIEAAWNSFQKPLTDEEYDTILETKKFPFPEGCDLPPTVEALPEVIVTPDDAALKDFELPADKKAERVPLTFNAGDPIPPSCDKSSWEDPGSACAGTPPATSNQCFLEDHTDGRPVYAFRHKNRDGIEHGCVINDFCEWGERVCVEHLEQILRENPINGTNKGKCPITADCKEKLFPEEIKGIVSDAVYQDYKGKFNEVNSPGYKRRGGGKKKGGSDPSQIVVEKAKPHCKHVDVEDALQNVAVDLEDPAVQEDLERRKEQEVEIGDVVDEFETEVPAPVPTGGKRIRTFRKRLNRKRTSKK